MGHVPSLNAALADALCPGGIIEQGDGAAAIAEDDHRLNRLLALRRPASSIRLWTNPKCLVTTRSFARLAGFGAASAASAARGWPVSVRPSGGTTVAHRRGMLNVSFYEVDERDRLDVTERFACFAQRLARAINTLGIPARTGWVEGSHCDGRFNIVAMGKKIAGTACLVRTQAGWTGMLTHATIWTDGDVAQDLDAIMRLEQALGRPRNYAAAAHSTLRTLLCSDAARDR